MKKEINKQSAKGNQIVFINKMPISAQEEKEL